MTRSCVSLRDAPGPDRWPQSWLRAGQRQEAREALPGPAAGPTGPGGTCIRVFKVSRCGFHVQPRLRTTIPGCTPLLGWGHTPACRGRGSSGPSACRSALTFLSTSTRAWTVTAAPTRPRSQAGCGTWSGMQALGSDQCRVREVKWQRFLSPPSSLSCGRRGSSTRYTQPDRPGVPASAKRPAAGVFRGGLGRSAPCKEVGGPPVQQPGRTPAGHTAKQRLLAAGAGARCRLGSSWPRVEAMRWSAAGATWTRFGDGRE